MGFLANVLALLLLASVDACNFNQIDFSTYTNFKFHGPAIVHEHKDQVECLVVCGKSPTCFAVLWNLQNSQCGFVDPTAYTEDPPITVEESPANLWNFFVKEEFSCVNNGKVLNLLARILFLGLRSLQRLRCYLPERFDTKWDVLDGAVRWFYFHDRRWILRYGDRCETVAGL